MWTKMLTTTPNAAAFYTALGFNQTGPGIERAGGCIPFEFDYASFDETRIVQL
jgi:hypothetical protein